MPPREQARKEPRRRRKWLRRLGGVLLVAGAIVLAMPVWLPWVIVPVVEKYGVTIESYDRRGFTHLDLLGIEFSNDQLTAKIESGSVQWPLVWLLDRYSGPHSEGEPQLSITDWRVQIHPVGGSNDESANTNSLVRVLDQTREITERLRPWIGLVRATNGLVAVDGQAFAVERISVSSDAVKLSAGGGSLPESIQLELDLSSHDGFDVSLQAPELALVGDVQVRPGRDSWQIEGVLDWRENRADLAGRVAGGGWLPEQLALSGANWNIPAEVIGLVGYEELAGSFNVGWTNAHYVFAIHGGALPTLDTALLPDRIDIDVAGQGTLDSLAIESLNIVTPALQARLSDTLAIDFEGRLLVPETTLEVAAHFIPEDGLPFTGVMDGTLTARPDVDDFINADFALQVSQFAGFGLNVDKLALGGALNWPLLAVTDCSFTFPNAGQFNLTGNLDLITEEATDFQWTFSGAVPAELLPAELSLEDADMSGRFNGVWPDFNHQTSVELRSPAWKSLKLDRVRTDVAGTLTASNNVTASASSGNTSIEISSQLDVSGLTTNRLSALVESVTLQANENTTLKLREPFRTTVHQPGNTMEGLKLLVEPMTLADEVKSLSASATLLWPSEGSLLLSATNLTTSDFSELQIPNLPDVRFDRAELSAQWTNSPITFDTSVRGELAINNSDRMQWDITVNGDETGALFAPSEVKFNDATVFELQGRVPGIISLNEAGPQVEWIESEAFELEVNTVDATEFWNEIEQRFGIRLTHPQARLTATGDLERFRAELELDVASIQAVNVTNVHSALTTASNLTLRASATQKELSIRDGSFQVAGAPAEVAAQVQLDADSWEETFEKIRRLDWRDAAGTFRVPEFEISTLAPVLGNLVRPLGSAAVDVELKPGGTVQGTVTLNDLATRAIEPVGSVRGIGGTIRFDHQQATLEGVQGRIGGERAEVNGTVEWDETGLGAVDVAITATNITVVRTIDLFLRGDADLYLRSDGKSAPVIGGDVRLHNSLLFQDIGSLLRVDLDRPETRPPFFSVPVEPFSDWGLDIRVRGQGFLRVLSPVFRGSVSTGLQLSGTLKEPIAVGEVSIESGQIVFPFGNLEVRRGNVQLTRQDPHRPRVDFRGQGMNFGYNVSIDVTGNADAPNIIFNSVPPLTAREIMMMLTAGEIPSGEFSFSNVDKASRLGFFLGKELINQLLGVDSGEERLVFRTGEYVTVDGQLTYRIEYRLIDWLAIFGEYTRFRDYNGGLKFRVYSR